jgi:ribosomal protein S18 acetylase RimI-like enzyme
MTVNLRVFEFDRDYDRVFRLWQLAGEGLGIGRSDQPEEIIKKTQRDPDLFLVAEAEGQIVGSVIGGFDGRRGLVYHLAVAAEYRKHGLGSRLMDEVEARMRAKGCRRAYLLVKQGNEQVVDFYEKRGWHEMNFVRVFGKDLDGQP